MTAVKEKASIKPLTFPTGKSAGDEMKKLMLAETNSPVGTERPASERAASERPASKPIPDAPVPAQEVDTTDNTALHTTILPVTHNSSSTVVLQDSSLDPLRTALINALAKPFAAIPEGNKPTLAVTSIKILPEVWDRMKIATQLTGKNQQVLIDEAIRDMFAKIIQKETQSGTAAD